MKLSTKIMMGLVLSGIVFIVSLLSFIRYTGDDTLIIQTPVHEISTETVNIPLPYFETLAISMSSNNDLPLIFDDSFSVNIIKSDTLTSPVIILPQTFTISTTDDNNGQLEINISAQGGRYSYADTIGINIISPTFVSSVSTDFPNNVSVHYNVDVKNNTSE